MSTWQLWLLACTAIIGGNLVLFYLGYRYFASRAMSRRHQFAQTWRHDMHTLRHAMDGLDECLVTFNDAMQQRQNTPTSVAGPADDRTYGIAHRLASRGASVDDLMRDCGLRRGEAELIFNLNSVS